MSEQQAGAGGGLGPLPAKRIIYYDSYNGAEAEGYTEEDMRAYAAAAVAAERERCAMLCQAQASECDSWDEGAGGDGGRVAANMCAAAIRGA